jgi:hypothetical protein
MELGALRKENAAVDEDLRGEMFVKIAQNMAIDAKNLDRWTASPISTRRIPGPCDAPKVQVSLLRNALATQSPPTFARESRRAS